MIYDQFPDADGNEVIVRASSKWGGIIEVLCHAPSPPYFYNKDECYPMYLDAEQAERFAAAVTKASKEEIQVFLRWYRTQEQQAS